MLKKALFWDDNRNQIEPRTGFLQFYVKKKIKTSESTYLFCLFRDDATTGKGPGYDEGTYLH